MKLDTGTELPDKFILTDEFKEFCKLINETSINLFITGKQDLENQHCWNILGRIQTKIL